MPRRHFTDSTGREWHVAEGVSLVWDSVLEFDDHPETALLFDAADEARRLFDYPEDWSSLPDTEIQKLLDQAAPSWTRTHQAVLGEHIIDTFEETQAVLELESPELLGPLGFSRRDEGQPDSAFAEAESNEEVRKPAA